MYESLARAKINLTLHVGTPTSSGVYEGYHPVDSLVVFADIGDNLRYDAAGGPPGDIALTISGPFSDGLGIASSNLVLKAARAFFKYYNMTPCGSFHLIKNLPLASGIGGGSADAAAALRLLGGAFKTEASDMMDIATKIGADVPVCYVSKTAHMQGIGEQVTLKPAYSEMAAILVNPGFAVSTADIFNRFDRVLPPSHALKPQVWDGNLYDVASVGRNDLQPIAISLRPEINHVIKDISQQAGCRLARMSGSGATCFGLFDNAVAAKLAAQAVTLEYPNYWCRAVSLGEGL